MLSKLKRLLQSVISISTDEVLQQQLRVCEVARIIVVGLSMASDESFLQIGSVPDPSLHLISSEQMFSFSNELISSHLNVLIKEVATKNLLSVLVIEQLRVHQRQTQHALSCEEHVFIVEKDVVVIKEQERCHGHCHSVLFIQGVVNIQVSHVIVPLWVVWIKEQS